MPEVTDLLTLQQAMGFTFNDENLLRLAMTHPSVVHEQGSTTQHNQRLEFLGDAVLQLVLTQNLYLRFPDFGEGPLTKARARLVNRRFLAEQARNLAVGRYLRLSRGEDQQGGRERLSALADAFEALVGAVFLDAGLDGARRFVLRIFDEGLRSLEQSPGVENPKGELQEMLQASSSASPTYAVQNATGPDHDRVFECAVFHSGKLLARGHGRSKKDAESAAATAALELLRAAESAIPGPASAPPPKPAKPAKPAG